METQYSPVNEQGVSKSQGMMASKYAPKAGLTKSLIVVRTPQSKIDVASTDGDHSSSDASILAENGDAETASPEDLSLITISTPTTAALQTPAAPACTPKFLVLTPDPSPLKSDSTAACDKYKSPNGKKALKHPAEVPKRAAEFTDLPTEALKRIFIHLRNKRSQLPFMLAGRRHFNLLLPLLYHRLRFCLDSLPSAQEAIARMVACDGNNNVLNKGLQHVRRLEFFACDIERVHTNVAKFAQVIIDALQSFGLEWFSWPTGIQLPAALSWALWTPHTPSSQRSLTNLILTEELWATTHDARETKAVLDTLFSSASKYIRHVQVVPRSKLGLESLSGLFSRIMTYRVVLESFVLDLRLLFPRMEPGNNKWDGLVTEPVSHALFRHLAPTQAIRLPPYSAITRLVFKSVNLFMAEPTFLKVFSVRQLKHLELIKCPFAGRVLDKVAVTLSPGQLKVLKVDHQVDSQHEKPSEISEALMKCLKTQDHNLLTLWIRLRDHKPIRDDHTICCKAVRSLLFDTSTHPSQLAIQKAKTDWEMSSVGNCGALQILTASRGRNSYIDIAIPGTDRYWFSTKQLETVLECARPLTLTLILPWSTQTKTEPVLYPGDNWSDHDGGLELLHDKAQSEGEARHIPPISHGDVQSEDDPLDPKLAREIASTAFAVDSAIRIGASGEWTLADVSGTPDHGGLKIVVIIEEVPSRRSGLCSPSEVSHPQGMHPFPVPVGSTMGMSLGLPKPRRYIFMRGSESIVIEGTVMTRDVAVPVPDGLLEHVGVDVPMYFDGDEE